MTSAPGINQIKLLETYLYYDQPLIFACEINGQLHLGYAWEFLAAAGEVFVYFPTTAEQLAGLTADKISLRQFFKDQSLVVPAHWVRYVQGQVVETKSLTWAELERSCYVAEGVFLNREEN